VADQEGRILKVVAMMKRKPGISPDEFARYWYEEHAPLGFEVLPDDEKNFMDSSTVKVLVMREQIVVQPPAATS
jgi:hypothetical protein